MTLFRFLEKKEGATFGPVFQPLLGPLDDAAKALIVKRLSPDVPSDFNALRTFFDPYYGDIKKGDVDYHIRNAKNLRRTIVDQNGLMPLGLLEFCLNYAGQSHQVGGVFEAIRKDFVSNSGLLSQVKAVYEFRNNRIAHVSVELTDRELASSGLRNWIDLLLALYHALPN